MINLKLVKENPDILKKSLKMRNFDFDVDKLIKIDNKYKEINLLIEKKNSEKNIISKNISNYVAENKKELIDLSKKKSEIINKEIEKLAIDFEKIKEELNEMLLSIPNILNEKVPNGLNEKDNIEIKRKFNPKNFDFDILSHWEIGKKKNILDLEKSTKLTGSRFSIYKNKGAKLIRALQSFMLDVHAENDYEEYIMPLIINSTSLKTTGQLPKFKDDLFKIDFKDYFLSPTLEVQLINLYRNEIIEEKTLPLKIMSSSFNFRSEAGAAGKDVKGVLRQHQFMKTELVNICKPEESYNMLDKMVNQATKILDLLEVPYRIINLCSGDIGFGSSLTYDIEVWLPSYDSYKEISSCSNCEDFQSRRGVIRYNDKNNKKIFVHTLNGTGISIDRLWAAIIENYQDEKGDVIIPKILKKYLDFEKI